MSSQLEQLLEMVGNSIEISGPTERAMFPHKTAAVKVFEVSGYKSTTYWAKTVQGAIETALKAQREVKS